MKTTTTGRPRLWGARAPSHRWGALCCVVILAVALYGCGSAAAKLSGTSSTSTKSSFAAYSACLKAHGVNLPANFRPRSASTPGSVPSGSFTPGSVPSGSFPRGSLPSGVNATKFRAARAACQSKLPKGAFAGRFGSGGPRGLSNLQAYESCLTSNGVTLSGTGYRALASLNRSDPTVQAAIKTCQPLLQAATTTTTTTAPSG